MSVDASYLQNSVWKADIFKDKVAFVTGGAGTIGRVQVAALVALGANAVILGRNAEKTEKVAKEIEKIRPGAKVVGLGNVDVRDVKSLKTAADKTVEIFGKIDFVIAGAAGNFIASVNKLSANAFKTVIDIDLIGSYNTVKATMDYLKETKGVYLFVSAGLHYAGVPFQIHAAAAKAGVDSLSNVLAIELGPLGIRSNTLAPGIIAGTEGIDRLMPGDLLKNGQKSVPLQKLGTPRDVAEATVFLLSPAASYISGTTVVVDAAQWRVGNVVDSGYPYNVIQENEGKTKL